ncbi:putative phage abortive infection protein, partial [Klebsiella michiganensis]|uniref:putative phage abortive infection protein n=2 Tax=Klebsiella michiganensis TaxID=1134687 RepID=UPI0019E82BD2
KQGQNQPRRDDFGLKIGKLSHRTSIKDGLGRHIGSCGPLNRNFLRILYHMIKFIDSDVGYYPFDFKRKKKYTSLVRAHMDSEITYLLAINCAHAKPGGQYYSYKILIERYALLEHLIFNKSFLGKYYHPDLQNRSQKDLRLINCLKKHTPLGEIAIRYNDNAFGCNPDRIDFL